MLRILAERDLLKAPSPDARAAATGHRSVYVVPKMDCPAEEQFVRLALAGETEVRACPSTCPRAG